MPQYDTNTRRTDNRQGDWQQDDDWTEQVNWNPRRGPYEDYGWDRDQSVLPEFRDPSVHFTYEEQQRIRQFRDWESRGRNRMEIGPYSGIGPKGYQRADDLIMEDVCDRLMQHGQVNARAMQVNVQNGEVTLEGNIDSRQMKRLAEDTAMSVRGVKDVHNHLKVKSYQESGMPGGGAGRVDEVGRSGVHPASGPMPKTNAETQGMASWGQGERGAAGYQDHGDSEINSGKKE